MQTHRSIVRRRSAWLAALVPLLVLAGCERPPALPDVTTFVGYVENSDAFIALSRVEDRVVAYVCDGRATATWLRGNAEGTTFDVTSGEARLRASFGRDGITGTFTSAQGGAYPFTARPAARGAGFYRATQTIAGVAYVGGWILLSDGQQRGAVKRDGAIVPGPQPRLDPARPAVALPAAGTLMAEPAEAMLAKTPAQPARLDG